MAHYNDLLSHFLPTPTAPVPALPPLCPLLRALTANVSILSPETHTALVSAIVNLPWAAGDEKFVKTFVGFCGVLVSAQPGWAKEVVGMAVHGLTWRTSYLNFISPPSLMVRQNGTDRLHLRCLSHVVYTTPDITSSSPISSPSSQPSPTSSAPCS
jgi:RNA polymerase I-specific transcription initiation factor RRN3